MLLQLCLLFILSASVCSESQVRETETWMPMKATQTSDVEASGDGAHDGSDFGFTDDDEDEDDYYSYDDEEDDEEEEEEEEFSGSGDGATTSTPEELQPSVQPDSNSNKIPELQRPAWPTVNEVEVVRNSNEIPPLRTATETEEYPSNVLMSHAAEDGILNKTEVLAALIAGGAVGLMFAVLLILLLIYRMKKKDEGSYELGKKPIYKKAPTTEIYA